MGATKVAKAPWMIKNEAKTKSDETFPNILQMDKKYSF